jgi:aldehyde dehydrogenase (NAD+)
VIEAVRQDVIFVDGSWCAPRGSVSHELVNPASGEIRGTIILSGDEDVNRAVTAADVALHHGPWSSSSLDERIEAVEAIRDWLVAHQTRLAGEITVSMGLPIRWAQDLLSSIAVIDMSVESIRSLSLEYLRAELTGTTLITRRPVGVVAAITPWNTPLRSEVKKVIPALLAGCTVVIKPAPDTPCGAVALAEAAVATGLPPGVLNVVFGGSETGVQLVSHPAVSKIAFTGSTKTGAHIARAASSTFKRLQLELGGKSAAIVLDDADLVVASQVLAQGNFFQSGQMCAALSRVLVPQGRGVEIANALAEAASAYVPGDPLDEATTMGPLVNRSQYERVLRYIGLAEAEGAKIFAGGRRPEGLAQGYYVEPTVLVGVEPEMTVAREEIFGPVACIIEYRDEEHAVLLANDSPYGLSGTVLSADEEHALSIARRIDSGIVNVNRFGAATATPFGGVKQSGIGREHGPEGFDSFLEYHSHGVSDTLAASLAERGVPMATWGETTSD